MAPEFLPPIGLDLRDANMGDDCKDCPHGRVYRTSVPSEIAKDLGIGGSVYQALEAAGLKEPPSLQ
jgi:hypothetical protein